MKGKNLKVSLLYGKPVESTDGKKGYVISVNELNGRIECLICADCDEKEFTVDARNIVKIGAAVVFEDRESAINNSRPIRLGIPSFDTEGRYLGTLSDFSIEKDMLASAYIGRKKYPAADVACGDAAILKRQTRVLKSDVVKDGRIILKRGEPLTRENLLLAQNAGEYIQTNLKSI